MSDSEVNSFLQDSNHKALLDVRDVNKPKRVIDYASTHLYGGLKYSHTTDNDSGEELNEQEQ